MAKRNPHSGSSFDDLLKGEVIFEEVQARALKRALPSRLRKACRLPIFPKSEWPS